MGVVSTYFGSLYTVLFRVPREIYNPACVHILPPLEGATPEVLAVLSILPCRAVQGTRDLRIRVFFFSEEPLNLKAWATIVAPTKFLRGFKKGKYLLYLGFEGARSNWLRVGR
jgi:hypothetical protein